MSDNTSEKTSPSNTSNTSNSSRDIMGKASVIGTGHAGVNAAQHSRGAEAHLMNLEGNQPEMWIEDGGIHHVGDRIVSRSEYMELVERFKGHNL